MRLEPVSGNTPDFLTYQVRVIFLYYTGKYGRLTRFCPESRKFKAFDANYYIMSHGVPERARTSNLRLRKAPLYLIELQEHIKSGGLRKGFHESYVLRSKITPSVLKRQYAFAALTAASLAH
jgi:hypothetical protein